MIDTNWLKRHKRQLLRQAKRELRLVKETYTLGESAALLRVSAATLFRHLADPDLEIGRHYSGPHKQRLLDCDDLLVIWMKRHTIYGAPPRKATQEATQETVA